MKTLKGNELTFISQIRKDGSGLYLIDQDEALIDRVSKEIFSVLPLSISEKTYVAHGFGTYVVKLKNE